MGYNGEWSEGRAHGGWNTGLLGALDPTGNLGVWLGEGSRTLRGLAVFVRGFPQPETLLLCWTWCVKVLTAKLNKAVFVMFRWKDVVFSSLF